MKAKCFAILNVLILFLATHLHGFSTSGDQILDATGKKIELKGINWFGFNNQSTMVDGLWGSDILSGDFATVVYRMQLLGFNAVRLPFSFKDLYELSPRNYNHSCQEASQAQIQASVTNPNVPVPSGKVIPPMFFSPTRTPNTCNSYVPNTTTLQRFLWVINFFARNGFYVLIDNHLREDQTVIENSAEWVQNWVTLVTQIAKDPISRNMVMIDVLNEPDEYEIRWEDSNGKKGLSNLYLSAMDAIFPVLPEALFVLEGTGQSNIGANWGDGFATDPNLIQQNGLSDPNPFFKTLMTKPYVNQVAFSPHVYPPSVTGATSDFSGTGLWTRLSRSFGYLTQKGYCSNNSCKQFPIIVGEFGSRFSASNDLRMLQDFSDYLNNKGSAADGQHHAIANWFYWSWNPNSSDTGGVVEDDWKTIIWKKIDFLTLLGLKPWYSQSITPTKQGTLCVSVKAVTGLTKDLLKPATAGSYTFDIKDFNQPVCKSLPVGQYSVTIPEIIKGNTKYTAAAKTATVVEDKQVSVELVYEAKPVPPPPPPPPPPPSSTFLVEVETGTSWEENDIPMNSINLYIKNTGKKTVEVPWKIEVFNPNYEEVTTVWNMRLTSFQNHTLSAIAFESWERLLPNKANSVNVGFIVSSRGTFKPTSIKINNGSATIVSK